MRWTIRQCMSGEFCAVAFHWLMCSILPFIYWTKMDRFNSLLAGETANAFHLKSWNYSSVQQNKIYMYVLQQHFYVPVYWERRLFLFHIYSSATACVLVTGRPREEYTSKHCVIWLASYCTKPTPRTRAELATSRWTVATRSPCIYSSLTLVVLSMGRVCPVTWLKHNGFMGYMYNVGLIIAAKFCLIAMRTP